ncbi:UNVERIFIED_CONTAM: hypothetical protein FKN15_061032 [Acipenser sinensis]
MQVETTDLSGKTLEGPVDVEVAIIDQNDNRPVFKGGPHVGEILEGSLTDVLTSLKPESLLRRAIQSRGGQATDPGEQRSALHFIHSECALCLASRVRCCAMRIKSPCWFPIPHPGSVRANVTPPSESPERFGFCAQPGRGQASSEMCDSSCAARGNSLTG